MFGRFGGKATQTVRPFRYPFTAMVYVYIYIHYTCMCRLNVWNGLRGRYNVIIYTCWRTNKIVVWCLPLCNTHIVYTQSSFMYNSTGERPPFGLYTRITSVFGKCVSNINTIIYIIMEYGVWNIVHQLHGSSYYIRGSRQLAERIHFWNMLILLWMLTAPVLGKLNLETLNSGHYIEEPMRYPIDTHE